MSSSSTALIAVPRVQISKTVPIVTLPGAGKKKRKNRNRARRRRKNQNQNNNSVVSSSGRGGGNLTDQYTKSLINPFEYSGVPLGWGTMVPTSLNTCYYRVDLTTNADGSITVMAVPNNANLFYYNASGAVGTTWTPLSAGDNAAVTANYSAGRVISLGIRAIPSIAMTSAPGYVFGGALPYGTNTLVNTLSNIDMEMLPQTQFLGCSLGGASCTGRPVDVSSYEFYPQVVNNTGWTGGTVFPFSCPYITFLGLPATTHIQVEIILNFEGLPLVAHAGAPMRGPEVASSEGLNSEWLTPDSLWRRICNKLPACARALNQAADIDTSTLFRGARYAARVYNAYNNRRGPNLNYPMLM